MATTRGGRGEGAGRAEGSTRTARRRRAAATGRRGASLRNWVGRNAAWGLICFAGAGGQRKRLGRSSSSSSTSASVILVSKSSMVYFSCWSPVRRDEWVSTERARR